MVDIGFIVIITFFIVYYFLILFTERKVIQEPAEILEKFLSVLLVYAGISIIYFSITGKPFLNESQETYSIYIFLMGFIALLYAVPNLLSEFRFFRKFTRKKRKVKT